MAIDDLETLDDERAVELSSIAAIFPELVLDSTDETVFKAHIDVEVNLLTPLSVIFTANKEANGAQTPRQPIETIDNGTEGASPSGAAKPAPEHAPGNVVELMHLPSVRCDISLSKGYPEARAPVIKMSCDKWLSDARLRELEEHAQALWEEVGRNVMLFDYLDWAAQLAQNGFGIVGDSEPKIFSRDLETSMLDFDLQSKRAKFERETFDCGVCLEPRKGAVCHKMVDCGHVFCMKCLQDFYTNCITEGDVANVKCMDPGCDKERLKHLPEKKRRKADLTLKAGELVAMQLEPAMVQRYLQMKRKKLLESDKNTVYCPRKWCQGAARSKQKEQVSDDEAGGASGDEDGDTATVKRIVPADRLSICSDCSFAFCSRCLNGWHGEYVACRPPRTTEELSAEEKATQDYLFKFSTRCPTCDSPVQKTMGCNHMLCQLCRTHFCYLCSAYLVPENPYAHYNTRGQGCYQNLWVLEGGDFEGAPRNFPVADVQAIAPENPVLPELPAEIQNLGNMDFILFEEDTSSSEEDEVAPPPAPMPPRGRGRGRGRGGNRGRGGGGRARGGGGGPGRGGGRGGGAGRAPPVAVEAEPANDARPPLPAHDQHGLQRFLRLAELDMEDEWDSDELDSDDDGR